ncbi:MAG: cation transporter [Actinomycetota bacterium]|jgi:copper chaperone|nr:cation transporter [Actinomycetota bacterium]MDQ3497004.1 cation transporter [Actinomycetota bacterium]
MTEIKKLNVPDMTCGHCESSLQEALTELDGVRGSKADHKEGTVEVTYEANRVTDEQFREVIAEAGYTLRS